MRRKSVVSTAVAATMAGALTLGAAGAASAAMPGGPAGTAVAAPEQAAPPARAALPDVEALASQVTTLDGMDGVLAPVTELLAVLTAEDGLLPAADAAEHEAALTEAIGKLATEAPEAGDRAAAPDPAALAAEAAEDLQAAVDALLEAVASGDPTEVVGAANETIAAVVALLLETLLDGDLPAPDVPDLPGTGLPTTGLPGPPS